MSSFHANLVVESDSLNAIYWVSSCAKVPWRFQFYFNEIKSLSSSLQVKFQHMGRMTNSFWRLFDKQGADRSSGLLAFTMPYLLLRFLV